MVHIGRGSYTSALSHLKRENYEALRAGSSVIIIRIKRYARSASPAYERLRHNDKCCARAHMLRGNISVKP